MFEFKIQLQTKLRNEENKIGRKGKNKKNKRATWADCLSSGPLLLLYLARPNWHHGADRRGRSVSRAPVPLAWCRSSVALAPRVRLFLCSRAPSSRSHSVLVGPLRQPHSRSQALCHRPLGPYGRTVPSATNSVHVALTPLIAEVGDFISGSA
jgi:hypothetical protein